MLTHFYISQQGKRHIEKKTPCQDCSFSIRVHSDVDNRDIIVAAIADGVGSCEYSQYGAEKSVASFCTFVQGKILDNEFSLDDKSVLSIINKAFIYALQMVEEHSEKMELPFMEFDSTLTGAIYDGENVWYGHIGDDGIVALYNDGTYELITTRHKGEEAHSLFPLKNTDLWEFGKTSKSVASFAMMTDGVLDYCVDSSVMNNRVYFPFLEPALACVMNNDEKAALQRADWYEYLSGSGNYKQNFRDSVSDDITLVVVENSESVKKLPEIIFDFEKWEADTQKRKKELDDKLFADYRKYKSQKTSPVKVEQPCSEIETKTTGKDLKKTTNTSQVGEIYVDTSVSETDMLETATNIIEGITETIVDAVKLANRTGKLFGKKVRDKKNDASTSVAGDVKKVEQSFCSEELK